MEYYKLLKVVSEPTRQRRASSLLSQAIAEGDSFLVIELSGEGSKRSQERQAGAQKWLTVMRVGQTS